MDTGVKRGLGLALIGALAWGLAALVALMLGSGLPIAVEMTLGLTAIVGIMAIFGGFGRIAWTLLRR